MSQPVPSTPSADAFFRPARAPSVMPRLYTIGVKTGPGATQFTRIPSRPWSTAIARVSAMTAPFEVEYAVRPRGRSAEIEDTLTIAPRPAVFRMAGMAWREARNIVSTFTCITRRQVSGSSSTTVARLPMPTLLSRKSRRPKRSRAAATMSRHPPSSVTSASWAAAVPPSAAIIATVRSASARARSTTRTLVPARASSMAAARPLPMPSSAAPPPVTMATRPSSPGSSSGRVVIASLSSRLGPSAFREAEADAAVVAPLVVDLQDADGARSSGGRQVRAAAALAVQADDLDDADRAVGSGWRRHRSAAEQPGLGVAFLRGQIGVAHGQVLPDRVVHGGLEGAEALIVGIGQVEVDPDRAVLVELRARDER